MRKAKYKQHKRVNHRKKTTLTAFNGYVRTMGLIAQGMQTTADDIHVMRNIRKTDNNNATA